MKKNLLYLLALLFISLPSYSISFLSKSDSVGAVVVPVSKSASQNSIVSNTKKPNLFQKVALLLLKKKFNNDPLTEAEITKANNHATAGLIFGILGILLLPFLAVPGLIFSNKALKTEKLYPGTLKQGSLSMAKTGKVMSWIGLVLLFFVFLYLAVLIAAYSA